MGLCVLIDEDDLEIVSQHQWHAAKRDSNTYAASNTADGYYMHRFLNGNKPGIHVDHKNGNGLDNRRENLRSCSNAENRRNMRVCRGVSKFKGVAKAPGNTGRPWASYINFEGKKISLGSYETEVEAARAYNHAALQYHQDFAFLNVIEGLSYEESVTAPARNRTPGRPPKNRGLDGVRASGPKAINGCSQRNPCLVL